MSEYRWRTRAARAYSDTSRQQLGDALGVSSDTIRRIESGERIPKRGELLAIAEACRVPIWFLERGFDVEIVDGHETG